MVTVHRERTAKQGQPVEKIRRVGGNVQNKAKDVTDVCFVKVLGRIRSTGV
jgi:hypothetical protein